MRLIPNNRDNGLAKKSDPFDKLFESFFNDFDEDFFSPLGNLNSKFNCFQVDVIDNEDAYIIQADLPGMEKEHVQIEYDNNYLTIIAKREEKAASEKDNYIRRERRAGEFRRSFYIENIDMDQVDASFENGVLTINLIKVKPTGQKKVIQIK
jgi:HSP20 family protein